MNTIVAGKFVISLSYESKNAAIFDVNLTPLVFLLIAVFERAGPWARVACAQLELALSSAVSRDVNTITHVCCAVVTMSFWIHELHVQQAHPDYFIYNCENEPTVCIACFLASLAECSELDSKKAFALR
jgi:hypothetical protein